MSAATRTVAFGSAVGLHARPAATIAKAAGATGHAITLTAPNGKTASAASVLLLLTLGVHAGDEVVVSVTGDDAERVADDFAALVGSELEED